jgi:hypothetical protein
MSHMPLNHQLRPLYRVAAGACGLYILIFGIASLVQSGDLGFFAQDGLPTVLGLRANRAFAILSIVVGAIVVGGAVIGGNLDRWINLYGGIVFLVAGMAMMILLQTDLNFLGFTMATCIVSFIIGMVLFAAGLYGKVGPARVHDREEQFRHGEAPDPEIHPWDFEGGPKPASQTEDHRFA